MPHSAWLVQSHWRALWLQECKPNGLTGCLLETAAVATPAASERSRPVRSHGECGRDAVILLVWRGFLDLQLGRGRSQSEIEVVHVIDVVMIQLFRDESQVDKPVQRLLDCRHAARSIAQSYDALLRGEDQCTQKVRVTELHLLDAVETCIPLNGKKQRVSKSAYASLARGNCHTTYRMAKVSVPPKSEPAERTLTIVLASAGTPMCSRKLCQLEPSSIEAL